MVFLQEGPQSAPEVLQLAVAAISVYKYLLLLRPNVLLL